MRQRRVHGHPHVLLASDGCANRVTTKLNTTSELGMSQTMLHLGSYPRPTATPAHPRLNLSDGRPTLAPHRRASRDRVTRANIVIVKDGDWQLYYSHWGGCRMLDALIGGPELALRYAASLRRCEKDEWTAPSWADGGAVVDLDRRRVLFFGDSLMFDMSERESTCATSSPSSTATDLAGDRERSRTRDSSQPTDVARLLRRSRERRSPRHPRR